MVLSHGAGAEVRSATGITVFAGMIGVTLFGLFLTQCSMSACASCRGSSWSSTAKASLAHG